MHYYQFNIADYRKDTAHLKPIEHYIYRTLIDWYYLDEKPLPKETQVVSRRLGLGKESVEDVENVLSDFFVLGEEGWQHRRIDEEITEYHSQCTKNKENGKAGGRPTGSKNKPKETQVVSSGNPVVTLTTNQEPLTINQQPLTTHTGNSQDSDVCVSAGSCCKVLVQAGISGCNPSHPTLLALIDTGANEAEFSNAAQSALLKNKNSFAYVIGTVKKQREDAAGLILHKGAMPTFGKPEKFDPVAFVNGGNQQGDGHGRVIDIN